MRVIGSRLKDGSLLQIGLIVPENDEVLERYRETFSTAFLLIIGLGGIGAFLIAHRAMAGVCEVTKAAARIANGELDQPISRANRGEEIEDLATMFNTMQKRISVLITELKAVINNVAHDLRMPVTRMRGVAETTLMRDADRASYQEMAVMIIEESERLGGQINTILEIAEIDAGLNTLKVEPIDLVQIVRGAAELYQPAAEDKGITLALEITTSKIIVPGNRHALQRLLANLLDNAVKFTPAGGMITLTIISQSGNALLTVSDTGPGIAPEDREHIFDRFYRADTSRSTPGSGLGLALVQSITSAHHGRIVVESNDGAGSRFLVILPEVMQDQ